MRDAEEKTITENEREQYAAQQELIVRAARISRDVFKQYVIKDDYGENIEQAVIHREWTEHLRWCIRHKLYCAIIAPMGHGKTENMIIGDTLFDIGRNPNIRIKIICNTDQNARLRIGSIRKYIEESDAFRRVFPECQPDYKSKWNDHQLFLKRDSFGKDPSVEAWGIFSSGAGGRADSNRFDDPCDQKNSVSEPMTREKVIEVVKQTWMSRLDEHSGDIDYCPCLWIATPYHEKDASWNYIRKNKQFSTLIMGPDDHTNQIDCQRDGNKIYHIPLWDKKWDKAALIRRREIMGPRAYAQGIQCRPWSDADIVMPSFQKCINYSLSISQAMKSCEATDTNKDWRVISGVDISGEKRKGFCIFTGAVGRTSKKRIPLDIRIGSWSGRQAVDMCRSVQETLHPEKFVVENNACQIIFCDLLADAGIQNLHVEEFHTGNNKADPMVGLPSLDIEFSNNLWLIALKENDHRGIGDCECAWCRWIKEVSYYPMYGSTDILMASWFFREGDRGSASIADLIAGIKSAGSHGDGAQGLPTVINEMKPESIRRQHTAGNISNRVAAMPF